MFSFKSANPSRLLIRGIFSIIVGGIIVAVPDLTMNMVMRGLGLLMVIDGIVAFIIDYSQRDKRTQNPWALMPRGTLSAIIGAILLIFPGFLVNIFVFVLGIILFMAGFSLLTTQLSSRKFGVSWIMVMFSVVALVSGVVMITKPFESTQAILIFFGVIILLYGIAEIVWSFKLRKMLKEVEKNNPPHTVDADFEELE
jgi:uncharacterized membrane protein HdeD (DUF308 family)